MSEYTDLSADESEEDTESLDTLSQNDNVESEEEEAEVLALPEAEVHEELVVKIIPQQRDEFVCTSCFLVKHKSQMADTVNIVCNECE